MAHEHRFVCTRGALMDHAPVETNLIVRCGPQAQGRNLTVDGDAPGSDPFFGFPA
jgi:hypothetical protein